MKTTNRSYPLLPYSQLVWDLMQTQPDIYYFDSILRIQRADADPERLQNAFRTAIKNHPVFSMVVDAEGKQSYQPADDILNGQFHAVRFEITEQHIDIHIHQNRILGDAVSGTILAEDILRAYNGITIENDPYLDYLDWLEQYKKSDKYAQQRQALEKDFDGITDVHPNTDPELENIEYDIEGIFIDDFTDLREKINLASKQHVVPLASLFSLASALATMQYNNTDKAALTWAYEGRDQLIEQRIYGSLHRDIPVKIEYDTNPENLFRQIRTQTRRGISLSDYPYTLTKPHTDIWNYAVNVIHIPPQNDMLSFVPFSVEVIMPQTDRPAYALLDIEIYDEEQLTVLYRYNTTHYREQSIRKYADMLRQQLTKLIL